MKTFTPEQLADILGKHKLWLDDEEGGERADLRDANLRGANLRDAYLVGANLRGANLGDANLGDANLRGANLGDAYLVGANLGDANLRGANLGDAYLVGANLGDANLRGAYLVGANLRDAYLVGANLRGANLGDANLGDANLRGANLGDAYLVGANLGEIAGMNGASGNCREVKTVQCDIWPVTYTATQMQIGCQLHTIAEWWAFDDAAIARMDSQAAAWWAVWKPILKQIIEASPAVSGGEPKPEPQAEDAA